MEKSCHSIRNSVIASLIVAMIIAVIKPLRNIAISIVLWTWTQFLHFFSYILAPTSIPRFLFFVICFFSLVVLIKFVTNHRKKQSPRIYTYDIFFGLIWRWKIDSNFQPHSISIFCPSCDMELLPRSLGYGCSTFFHCDKCGHQSEPILMTPDNLDDWVIREIQRKIRTAEWREVIKTLEQTQYPVKKNKKEKSWDAEL
jgi:hypothetical protein